MAVHNIESFVNPDGTPGHSLNIVKGCNGPAGDGVHCSYCYAKRWVKRCNYAETVIKNEMQHICKSLKLDGFFYSKVNELIKKIKQFKPHFFEYVYAQKLRKKPTMYFFSMSDPADWKQEWYERIVEKIAQHMQHTFIVLTKRPEVYEKYVFPHNTWLGMTICTYYDYNCNAVSIDKMQDARNKLFISFEPIQNCFSNRFIEMLSEKFDWLIVGPETGTTKKTPAERIEPFFDIQGIPVFMKDSCSKIIDRPLRQEWPEGYRR